MYVYFIDFFEGIKSFGDELRWLRSFSLSFDHEPTREEIEAAARARMEVYPRRYTVKWEITRRPEIEKEAKSYQLIDDTTMYNLIRKIMDDESQTFSESISNIKKLLQTNN